MGRHRRWGRLLAAGAVAASVGLGALSAQAARTSHAQASTLKGSSCAHPYEAYWGQPRTSPWERLLGDTSYFYWKHHELPRGNNEHTTPLRRSYTWRALNGTHMCAFHVWVTDEYSRLVEGTKVLEKPVTLETLLDSHDPRGGRNVVVAIKDRCGPICGERDGRVVVHEVLTAARIAG